MLTIRDHIGGDWLAVQKYIGQHVKSPAEVVRRALALKRDRFYSNETDPYLGEILDRAFKSTLNAKLRKDFATIARLNPLTARIIDEQSSVYQEPCRRSVGVDDLIYQRFLDEDLDLDASMTEANRKLSLHEDVWIQYRIRTDCNGNSEPIVDVISPADFSAIASPKDPTALIAIVLSQGATYRVWTGAETFAMSSKFEIGDVEDNPIGMLPGVLGTYRLPSTKGALLARDPSASIIAGHSASLFSIVSLLKELKSATFATYIHGDSSAIVRDQVLDSENEITLPEGTSITTASRTMDMNTFVTVNDHVSETCAAAAGIPPSVLRHRDSSSGEEINLRRIPLRTIRQRQVPRMRAIEWGLAKVMSAVNARFLPHRAFALDEWKANFGEVQDVVSEATALANFETRKRLSLDSTLSEIRRRDVDLVSDQEASDVLVENTRNELARLVLTQQLSRLNGSTGTAVGDNSAVQNGANNGTTSGTVERKKR